MREWLHFWSFAVSIAACATLMRCRPPWSGRAAATAVYSVTVLGLFGISALYHRHTWHCHAAGGDAPPGPLMIFLFIAGSYAGRGAGDGPAHRGMGARRGVDGRAGRGRAQDTVAVRAGLGECAGLRRAGLGRGVRAAGLLHNAGVAALVLLLVGGALYTAGGVMYALRRPDPWPSTFGYHEFFHAATVLAAICHHVAIWLALFPG
jgi:hemolysin III